jgi:hypothetical protein
MTFKGFPTRPMFDILRVLNLDGLNELKTKWESLDLQQK